MNFFAEEEQEGGLSFPIGVRCNKCKQPIGPGQFIRIVIKCHLEDYDGELGIDYSLGDVEKSIEHDFDCVKKLEQRKKEKQKSGR